MRRFRLMNIDDMTDDLAEGVQFSDGTVAVHRGMGTITYPAVEVAEEDQRAWVEWIDHNDHVIGYVALDKASTVRCLTHPFLFRPHRDLMESQLTGEEPFLCSLCRRQLEEVYLERKRGPDLDSLVIGERASRTYSGVTILRCLSDPFAVTSAEWITRKDLPDGGNCGRCGADLLAFLNEPAKLCTLDRWEQARTAEPSEYRKHVPGCSKLCYHPDACWPVEG